MADYNLQKLVTKTPVPPSGGCKIFSVSIKRWDLLYHPSYLNGLGIGPAERLQWHIATRISRGDHENFPFSTALLFISCAIFILGTPPPSVKEHMWRGHIGLWPQPMAPVNVVVNGHIYEEGVCRWRWSPALGLSSLSSCQANSRYLILSGPFLTGVLR